MKMSQKPGHLRKKSSFPGMLFTCILLFACCALGICLAPSVNSSSSEEAAHSRERRQTRDSCNQTDIVFVLDSSASIGADHWGQVLSFCKFIVSNLPVGFNATRFGSVTFGNEATIDYNLNAYNTTKDILAAIDRIRYKDENTNTSGGLWRMKSELFTKQNGDRSSAPNIVLIITDGKSNYDPNYTIPYANEAKRLGIIIVVIGIGNKTDPAELEAMASLNSTGSPLVYEVDSYDALYTIQRQISDVACDVDVACQRHADLALLIDSSSNVGSDGYSMAREVAKGIISNLNVAEEQSNVALITYNDVGLIRFYLDRYHTRLDLKIAVDSATYIPTGGANLADALRLAREQVFVQGRGDRPDLLNIIVIIANRGSSDTAAASQQAKLARMAGIGIIAVALNGWLSENELFDITSFPVDYNLRIINSFSDLQRETDIVRQTVCDGGRPGNDGPFVP